VKKLLPAILLLLVTAGAASAQTFTVTNSGVSHYVINGNNDPTLKLVRGNTYTFNLNAPFHPFYIKTVSSTGTGNAYNDGVTGNGTDTGTLTFTVPMNAPNTLFYNCSIHAAMAGTIQVVDTLPASRPEGLVAFGLLALGLGAFVLRRRGATPA
jgi:hypothetical protein